MRIESHDFLVELGTEELPPKALLELSQSFAAGVRAGLLAAGLAHGEILPFATPRRLAIWVKRLAARQPEQNVKRRGPPVSAAFDAAGQPTRAALAFAQSCGTSVETLHSLEEPKGSFLFFIGTKAGLDAVSLLPAIVQAALDALPIPKRMRWGAGSAEFVRPVHWLVMLYGKEVIPATLLETSAGNRTQGHRFLAPAPIRLTTPASYVRLLRERGYVVADFTERREKVRALAGAEADALGGRALFDAELLDEVTALVEWPVAVAGTFDARFLALPREVLVSALQDHQRYFPLEDAHGVLMPWFITMSNIESREPAKVREGNERVVRPRLADAAFFWEQDRKHPLAERIAALDSVTFQATLGSLGDKARRVRALAGEIALALQADRAIVERAAELCKCDLLSAMVGEFPELQGVMGRYYALADGEPVAVADAIREHYLPRSAGDELPLSPAGTALAIADKLDTLAGIFAIGQKPTGTRDPFGLRRAAIGVLRTLLERRLDLDLRVFVEQAVALQPVRNEKSADDVFAYIMERLRSYYLEGAGNITTSATISPEMFDAVLATQPRSPLDFDARLKALAAFLELPEAASLTAANKRIANILRKAEGEPQSKVDVEALREDAEVRLFDAMRALSKTVANATQQRQYTAALGHLAQLRSAVDTFFDQVMVMDPDAKLRANRLALLGELRALFAGVADLSRLPG
jgi:glycyl-tRNA synthetase beta chain